jgi:ABC-type glycerol-3-phosphate transport system permease component
MVYIEKFLTCTIATIKRRAQGAPNINSKITEKPEKIVGYVLLLIGLVLVLIPACFGVLIVFAGSSAIPKILETPNISLNGVEIPVGNEVVVIPISDTDINEVMDKMFTAANLCLFLVVSLILVSAASVLMGKGVNLIKEVKLKVVSKDVSEEKGS